MTCQILSTEVLAIVKQERETQAQKDTNFSAAGMTFHNTWGPALDSIRREMNPRLKAHNLAIRQPEFRQGTSTSALTLTIVANTITLYEDKSRPHPALTLKLDKDCSVSCQVNGRSGFDKGDLQVDDHFPETELRNVLARYVGIVPTHDF